MNNLKGVAFSTDGSVKRLAITYDVIDENTGKIIKSNRKVNRICTDEETVAHIEAVEEFCKSYIDTL